MRRLPSTHRNSTVSCPSCVADAGERCITKDNQPFRCAVDAHPARVRKVKRLEDAALAEKIRIQGEAKVIRETRRFASTNPDTRHFLAAYQRICKQYKITIRLGSGSHVVLHSDAKALAAELKSLDKLCVKEKE